MVFMRQVIILQFTVIIYNPTILTILRVELSNLVDTLNHRIDIQLIHGSLTDRPQNCTLRDEDRINLRIFNLQSSDLLEIPPKTATERSCVAASRMDPQSAERMLNSRQNTTSYQR